MDHISIDLRMLRASGIGTYLSQLVPRLIGAEKDRRFNLLGTPEQIGSEAWGRADHVRVRRLRSRIYSLLEQVEIPLRSPALTDLFWSPHYNIPLAVRGRLLVTVHDLIHLRAEFVQGSHRRLYAKAMFAAVARRANAVICVSRHTADELLRRTSMDATRVHVIPNGVDPVFFGIRRESPPERPYLLYIGNVKPHKNLRALISAFRSVRDRIPHDLLIVGKKEGFITGDAEVERAAVELRGRVRFTGYLPDAELRRYLGGATALVFPSLYEGFGLPALEAMASGCPVLVSETTSLPEVCGDAALYFDPRRPEEIADRILTLVRDEGLWRELSARGVERARLFPWEESARRTGEVMEAVLRGA